MTLGLGAQREYPLAEPDPDDLRAKARVAKAEAKRTARAHMNRRLARRVSHWSTGDRTEDGVTVPGQVTTVKVETRHTVRRARRRQAGVAKMRQRSRR